MSVIVAYNGKYPAQLKVQHSGQRSSHIYLKELFCKSI